MCCRLTSTFLMLTFAQIAAAQNYLQLAQKDFSSRANIGTIEYSLECVGNAKIGRKGEPIDRKYKKVITIKIHYVSGRYWKSELEADGSVTIQSFDGAKVRGVVGLLPDFSNYNDLKVGEATGDFSFTPFNTDLHPLFFVTGSLIFDIEDTYYAGHFVFPIDSSNVIALGNASKISLKTDIDKVQRGHIREYSLSRSLLCSVTNLRIYNRDMQIVSDQEIKYQKVNDIWLPKSWTNSYYTAKKITRTEQWEVTSIKVLPDDDKHFSIQLHNGQKALKYNYDKEYFLKPESRVDDEYIGSNNSLVKEGNWFSFKICICILFFFSFCFLLYHAKKSAPQIRRT